MNRIKYLKVILAGLLTLTTCNAVEPPPGDSPVEETTPSELCPPTSGSSGAWARDAFLGHEVGLHFDEVVGRLAIHLVENGMARQVGINHVFRSGDRFRFEVTSNRAGRLVVLHRQPGEKLKLLWPLEAAAGHRIQAHQTILVPSVPGVFVLDKEVGEEHFYIAIESGDDVPQHEAHEDSETSPRIINFIVRGDLIEVAKRGISFKANSENSDPYLYFAPAADGEKSIAAVEFKLCHSELPKE